MEKREIELIEYEMQNWKRYPREVLLSMRLIQVHTDGENARIIRQTERKK